MKLTIIYLTIAVGCFIFGAGCKTARRYNTVIGSNYDKFDTIFLDDKSENIKYDMLELNEGEIRDFYFLLVNNTEYPISISRITTGDGGFYFKNCQYWKLNSYESSVVTFEFNTENRMGGFNKNLTISYHIDKKESEPDFYKVVKLVGTIKDY